MRWIQFERIEGKYFKMFVAYSELFFSHMKCRKAKKDIQDNRVF